MIDIDDVSMIVISFFLYIYILLCILYFIFVVVGAVNLCDNRQGVVCFKDI